MSKGRLVELYEAAMEDDPQVAGPAVQDIWDETLRSRDREAALESELAAAREALEAIAEGMSERGTYFRMRKFLDARDIYHGDLTGRGRDPVVEAVARAALTPADGGAK